MLEVLGKYYYLDIDKVIDKCRPVYVTAESTESEDPTAGEPTLELNVFKFECYKACIERVLNEYDQSSDELSAFTNKADNPSFGIAVNTLLKNEILIEEDNE